MTTEDRIEFLLQQGHEQLDIGQYSAALATFQQAADREPDKPQVLYGLGLACYWLERYRESVRYLTEALQVRPSYILALARRGMAYQELNENERGRADFERAISIEPQDYEDWRGRGLALDELERHEEAIASYDKAIEIKPDYYEAYNNRGALLCDCLKRYEEAIAYFEKAIDLKYDYHRAWRNRGIALSKLGRYEEAITSYDKAIELKPDYHYAWCSRGDALDDLGRYEEAIASYDKAIEIKPDDHSAWYNKGFALYELGRYEEAIASYDKAIEIKPDDHVAWVNRGGTIYNLKRYEEAIAYYDKAIEIQPDYHEAWYNKGIALSELGRSEEAIASYDKAIEIQPDYHEAWGNRGVTLNNLGMYEDAIASYDEALRLTDNQDWTTWNNRGVAVLYSQGYEATIQNYADGIFALQPQIPDYQQGVGELHLIKASYQYLYGKIQASKRFPSWFEAKQSYEAALKFLTFEDFPLRHLEVLQEYLEVCNALGDSKTIQERLEQGTQQLEELLRQCEILGQKITLSHKFAAFDQLRVDAKAESSDKQQQIQALELAERRKNTCLSWYQHGWQRAVPETTYKEMQQLLNRKTAIIYWHLSPVAITTFILRYKKPPIVQTLKPESSPQKRSFFGRPRRQATSAETANLKAAQQLEDFEKWMKTWQEDYQNYRQAKEKDTSSWRVQMPARLRQLAEVLDIPAILPHLQGIEQLILIPHRQLHLLPLHYLFNIVAKQQFAISYLPSARIGIDLQRQATSQANYLLNVEQAGLLFTDLQHATISQLFPNSQNLRGPAVTPADLIKALSRGSGIFHFAGHADHDLQDPLNSALQLMNAEKLTLKDIFTVTLSNYHLVCLSACETGMTSQQNLIDEYVGLVSGFVRMGVTHVLSSLWTVQEDVTTMLLIRFYQFLKQGVASVLALQQAQEWLRSVTNSDLALWYRDLADEFSGPKRIKRIINGKANSLAKMEGSEYPYAHPYYWAAYFLTGIER